MSESTPDRRQSLLRVLFFSFELLLVVSFAMIFVIDPRGSPVWSDAAGFTYWYAFVGLLIVSLMLRRSARHLANIAWLTLFFSFWIAAFFLRVV